MTLTRRLVKGSRLTNAEGDANIDHFDLKTQDGWADLVAPMDIQAGAPDAPTLTEWANGYYLPELSHTNDLAVLGKFHVNHNYKLGTEMLPHLHFVCTDNSSGVVRLGFRYSLARRHDSTGQITFTTPAEISLDFTIPANSANTHFVAEVPDGQGIPATHIEPDVMILMETFRRGSHVNDTFPGSIWAMTHDLHHQIDRAATINRSPNFYA